MNETRRTDHDQVHVSPSPGEEALLKGVEKNSLKQLEEALELIPDSEKSAYLEAKKRCPWLVEKEPGMMRFLTYDKFDVWAAAKRVVAYWNLRREFFGDEAFLRPMHMTGNGALSKDDLKVMSTGFSCVLPKDEHGRSVLCYIPSRLCAGTDNIKARRRCTFYDISVTMELTPLTQSHYSAIVLLNQVGFQRTLGEEPMDRMLWNMPLYAESAYLAHCPEDVSKHSFFGTVAPGLLSILSHCSSRFHVISANSKQDLAEQMVGVGYRLDRLPPEFGGTWNMEDLSNFWNERIKLEKKREKVYARAAASIASATVSGVPLVEKASVGKAKRAKSSSHAPGSAPAAAATIRSDSSAHDEDHDGVSAPNIDNDTEAEALDKKRALDRVYSRRKRLKQKALLMSSQATYADCLDENKRLKKENIRLQNLLQEANEVVPNHTKAAPLAAPTTAPSLIATGTCTQTTEGAVHLPPMIQQQSQAVGLFGGMTGNTADVQPYRDAATAAPGVAPAEASSWSSMLRFLPQSLRPATATDQTPSMANGETSVGAFAEASQQHAALPVAQAVPCFASPGEQQTVQHFVQQQQQQQQQQQPQLSPQWQTLYHDTSNQAVAGPRSGGRKSQ